MKQLIEKLKKMRSIPNPGSTCLFDKGYLCAVDTMISTVEDIEILPRLISCSVFIGKSPNSTSLTFHERDFMRVEGKYDALRLYLKGDDRVLRITEEGRNYIIEQMNTEL